MYCTVLYCTVLYYTLLYKNGLSPNIQFISIFKINREEVKNARVLANPGCYPTAAQLPLVPLLRAGLITPEDIIIDAKSGRKKEIFLILLFHSFTAFTIFTVFTVFTARRPRLKRAVSELPCLL